MALLDELLPTPDVTSRHVRRVAATPASALEVVRRLDLGRSPVVRVLFALRGLPRSALRLDGFTQVGFVLLAEDEESEFILGAVGQPWRLTGGLRAIAPRDFTAFAEPGFAKIAWSFRAAADEEGALVTTETRVACTDPASRRRFGRYWRVVGPFSGWIRRCLLDMVERDCRILGP